MANRTRGPFDPGLPVPAIVLGGSDQRATALPDAGRDKHPLTGYKGAAIRVGGRPLIAVLLDRMRACGRFDPIWVAGPERVYWLTFRWRPFR